MRRISFVFISVLCVSLLTTAQQRVLGDVKKKISSLTLTTDVYKSAIAALKPALTHDETKNMAETWYLQGKLQYGYYDKFIDAYDNVTCGNNVIDLKLSKWIENKFKFENKS